MDPLLPHVRNGRKVANQGMPGGEFPGLRRRVGGGAVRDGELRGQVGGVGRVRGVQPELRGRNPDEDEAVRGSLQLGDFFWFIFLWSF